MTGKSGVIANGVKQSVERLLRHFVPRNDGVCRLPRANALAMTRGVKRLLRHFISCNDGRGLDMTEINFISFPYCYQRDEHFLRGKAGMRTFKLWCRSAMRDVLA